MRTTIFRNTVAALAIGSVLGINVGLALAAQPVEVNTCGQELEGDGFITADLDCSGFPSSAISLRRRGSMDLHGFTLTSGDDGAVTCLKKCEVSNGVIRGGASTAIRSESVLKVHDLSVEDGGGVSAERKLRATDISVTGASGRAASAGSSVKITRGTFTGNGQVFALCAVCGDRVQLLDSIVSDNGLSRVGVLGSTRARLKTTTVSGHTEFGVSSSRLIATDSSIIGQPLDIQTEKKPQLKNTTCDTSANADSVPMTWGVCALD